MTFIWSGMRHAPGRLVPDYGLRLVGLAIPDDPAEPLTVRLQPVDATGEDGIETVRTRYVVGCDGARSAVRKAMGRELHGNRPIRPGA